MKGLNMITHTVHLVNELGNEIKFEFGLLGDEVYINATGPNSFTQHTWTLKEALTIRDSLDNIFKESGYDADPPL